MEKRLPLNKCLANALLLAFALLINANSRGQGKSNVSSHSHSNNLVRDIELPLDSLQKDSLLLLPRPYPDFMPLWFVPAGRQTFSLGAAERLQLTIDPGTTGSGASSAPYGIEVESIWLKK
jgi:hypothetical protein